MEVIHTLKKYISPYKFQFIFAVFTRATSDLANLFPAYAFSQIVSALAVETGSIDRNRIWTFLIFWIIATYYYRVGHDLTKFFGYRVAEYAGIDAKFAGLRHLFKLDLSWHEQMNAGNKIKRIDNAQKGINNIIRQIFNIVIEATINCLGVIYIFSTFDKVISYVLIVFVIIYFILAVTMSRSVSKRYKDVSRMEEKAEGLSYESINNIFTLKSLSIQKKISEYVGASYSQLKTFISKFLITTRIRNHVLDLTTRVFDFGILAYIIIQIENKVIAVAVLILFRSLFWKVIEAISELAEFYNEFSISRVYIQRYNVIMSEESAIGGTLEFPLDWKTLRIENIHFNYDTKNIFNDLNLRIEKGTKVGIVGISGSGKSTLFKLLLDLYETYEGEIFFDELSLKKINRDSYINNLSVVLQDTELFNETLKNNILLATRGEETDEKDLQKSIDISQLNDVVANLPNGYDALIGEKGIKLSGGERQRLGIARAVVRKPQILLLDEASSHLDAKIETSLHESLLSELKESTIIVIAHRLATIRNMNRIIVMDKGKIIEDGTFDELLAKKGEFFALWQKQNLNNR